MYMRNRNTYPVVNFFSNILILASILMLILTAMFAFAKITSAEIMTTTSASTVVSSGSTASLPSNCVVISGNLYLGASDRLFGGGNVARLQSFLISRGYLHSNVTGFYGTLTFSAVRNFQRDNGILAIGGVGPLTRNFIKTMSCGNVVPPVPPTSYAPVINGVDSPSTLSVNQTGTWTVRASDSTGGGLSYSVVWGDETQYAQTSSMSAVNNNFVQSTSFTHLYSQAGVYTPRFTVRGSNGLTAQLSVSVQVTGQSTYSPVITSISPSSGPYGTVVTVYGSGFTRYNNSINYAGRSAAVASVESISGTSLQFTIPATPCSSGMMCAQVVMEPGTYQVSVTNQNGTSNAVNFTLTSGTTGSVNQTVTVGIGQTAYISNSNLRIQPVRIVEDSRCPMGVYCIQAGRVVVETNIQSGDMVQSANLVYGGSSINQDSVIVDGYTVRITNVSPFARQGGLNSLEYSITYQVTK